MRIKQLLVLAAAVALVLVASVGSVGAQEDDGNYPLIDDDGGGAIVAGPVAVDTIPVDAAAPSVDDAGGLAITGRTFGGFVGAGVLAVVVGVVLVAAARRREVVAL